MLMSLAIKQFAIVDELDLDFSSGMTAFTGETGAGKSIMIDALMLALGGRADASVIRANQEKCDIQAEFSIESLSMPAKWLKAHELDISDTILLRRVIYVEGRSKSYVNGVAFPLQKVKELSEMLVDIHGQHQHQTLLDHGTHRQQLDHYAHHHDLVEAVYQAYRRYQRLQEALSSQNNTLSHHQQQALLQFQIEELSALDVQSGEIEALHAEHQRLHHAREYLEHVQLAMNVLQDDETFNLQQGLHQVLHALAKLPNTEPHVQNALEVLQNATIQCEEAINELRAFSSLVQLDPDRLQEVESRMSMLHQAARKYQIDVSTITEHLQVLEQRLEQWQQQCANQDALQQELQDALQDYQTKAQALRTSRQRFAAPLSQEITNVMQQLGMPKGRLTVEITPLDKMHAHGLDKVEYTVCINPGTPPNALAKVASGGELSRISLAIQMITAQRGLTPTLFFDEVDVGIGGATAALVGQYLRKLGERLQVFCVTHQPQVASCAHHHFLVEKHVEHQHTYSRINVLSEASRIEEIARMLGGLTINEESRKNAKALLDEPI